MFLAAKDITNKKEPKIYEKWLSAIFYDIIYL